MTIHLAISPRLRSTFLASEGARNIEYASGLLPELCQLITKFWIDSNTFDWALCQSLGIRIHSRPVPRFVQQALEEPCPFFPGKTIRETHHLIQPFTTIDGAQINMPNLMERLNAMHLKMFCYPQNIDKGWIQEATPQECLFSHDPPPKDLSSKQWLAILKSDPRTLPAFKTEEEMQTYLTSLRRRNSSMKSLGYQPPSARAVAISHFLSLALGEPPQIHAHYQYKPKTSLGKARLLTYFSAAPTFVRNQRPFFRFSHSRFSHATPMKVLRAPSTDPVCFLPRLFQEP
jgi:hypothetical protein